MTAGRNVYLILGASSDIGTALLSDLLSSERDSIFIAHYHTTRPRWDSSCAEDGNLVYPLCADLTDLHQVRDMVDQICDHFLAPTHIVFLPAVKMAYARFREFEWDSFARDFEIQIHALVELCKVFLPVMAKRKDHNKLVLVLSSVTLGIPPKFLSHYVMMKYAQMGLMRALASEYTPQQVNVNAVSPSMVETKFLDNVDSRLIEMMRSQQPGGFLNPSEVIPAIRFLLSEESDSIHGANIPVGGGAS